MRGKDTSLFGGKVHAVLFREYTKGRDIYDLDWYLRKKVPLNIQVVEDTEMSLGKAVRFTKSSIIGQLSAHLRNMDMKKALQDVTPFVFRPEELPVIFDVSRLLHLLTKMKIFRPTLPQEFLRKLLSLCHNEGEGSVVERIGEHFFEIKHALDEEGIFPTEELENSKVAIEIFLRKHQKLMLSLLAGAEG